MCEGELDIFVSSSSHIYHLDQRNKTGLGKNAGDNLLPSCNSALTLSLFNQKLRFNFRLTYHHRLVRGQVNNTLDFEVSLETPTNL